MRNKKSGYTAIGLYHPKNSINVGSVLRAAGCYDAAMVAFCGSRYKKAASDTNKIHNKIPLIHIDNLKDIIPYGCVPVAVDLVEGAIKIIEYDHPKNAFYIFGPEDGTLGNNVLGWCKDVIYVPTKQCMNLAATVNVVLYDRLLKQTKCQ